MKILLIQPPKPLHGIEAEGHWQLARPFSLLFLSASIRKRSGHQVEILDLQKPEYDKVPVKEALAGRLDFDVFGITATTYTRFEALGIAGVLKRLKPGAVVVAGGVHFMACARDTLERSQAIDIVVRGEGEITIVELLDALESGEDLSSVSGVTFRGGDDIVETPDREDFEDLDNLPVLTDFRWEDYPEYLFGSETRVKATSVMSSRGCPCRCIFCTKAGMKYRLRKPALVVDELELLSAKLGVSAFNFIDLTFTASPAHVREICREILDRKLKITWWCESRVNIDLELLAIMKSAGCATIAIGVESGSPSVLARISKGITVDQVVAFCRKCSELGIKVQPFFMFSHPGETEEDVRLTLDLVYRLERSTGPCAFQPSMVFPGTGLEEIARSRGILPAGFSWCDPYDSDLSRELGQFANVPLFMDLLTPDMLVSFMSEEKLRSNAIRAAGLRLPDLARKWVRAALRRDGTAVDALKYLFSPGFYREYFMNRRAEDKRQCQIP